jgi:riboflavin synthase
MFTGIIESLGELTSIETNGSNQTFWVTSPISNQLKPDQSVSHNGVCLTVEEVSPGKHRVTAIAETLQKTNLGNLKAGDLLNLERCMTMNGRIDGHIVQGHVDCTAICTRIIEKEGSWEFQFEYEQKFKSLLIEKGSVCINGTSLTVFNLTENSFQVAIIPFTYEHTNIHQLKLNDSVNIEFDMIGKYVNRIMERV